MAEMTKKALNKIKAAAFTEFKQGFSEEEMSVFAVEADCKRKNGHGRRRARQYGRITKPRQAAGLLGFVAEGYTVSV